jgi:hypothetical protein
MKCKQCGREEDVLFEGYCSLECATDDIGRLCLKLALELEAVEPDSRLIQLLYDRLHRGSRSDEF